MRNEWHPTQAIGPDGQRADVKSVENGLQCHCVCFECEQPVVARQGSKLRWHFAHHAPTNCRPTPESELHFFAKSLLADTLWLWIPAVEASAAGRNKQISKRRKYAFAEVRVEMADGNVRPDLILIESGGKALHVEIFVRHRVDSAKLAKLKGRGISSVEIDLSHLDWDDRSSWEAAILEVAPRTWLHNAKAAKVQQDLEAQAASEAARKQEVLDAEFSNVAAAFQNALVSFDSPDKPLTDQHNLARKRGFAGKVGHTTKGSTCFRVAPAYWQSRIVNRFVWDEAAGSPRSFETKDVLAHVQDLVRPGLSRISKETTERMQHEFPEFEAPWHVVHGYLKWLKDHWMFDKRAGGKQWLASSSAIHHRKEQEALWEEERQRKEDLAEWADFILSNIPAHETSDFNKAKWVDRVVASYDARETRKLCEAIYDMVVGRRGLAEHLLGLPLLAEYERQNITQAERRAEDERKRIARLEQAHREARVSALQAKAADILDCEAQDWLQAANERLGENTPLAVAMDSDEGLALAYAELKRIRDERRAAAALAASQARLQAALEKNRAELTDLANKRARDPVRAGLWCQSPNPKLGGKRPIDYCTDDRALRTCKEIMPANI
ncbi:DUF2384 domain-containing protein [Altericroceibacterium spongiae]|uniref:DUF2384 domain-containing protein n=1 Tax=Altericroceibacterium spongiae TaxID=2320269 RepID=A0A420ENP8_9SPHN|nr:competence protein CoiA family protein [Altericroceibacterium spongiae]RKF22339.1 DUF2384 domain-containing protein [Altericroceibacterium spongiae]